MHWLIEVVRILALGAMTAAVGISTIEYFKHRRLRVHHSEYSRGLFAIAAVSWLGFFLRVLTSINGWVVAVSPTVLVYAANSYFIFLGVAMSLGSLTMYRAAVARTFAERVDAELDRRM